MGIVVGFSLRQFSEVFKIRDADGQPYVLVGGQAVNYWAERYLSTEAELEKLQPFTSQDIDFKGNRRDVERIAQQLNLNANYPPKVTMTALSGFIPFQIGGLNRQRHLFFLMDNNYNSPSDMNPSIRWLTGFFGWWRGVRRA